MVKKQPNLDYSARPPVVNRRSHRVATSANWIVSRVQPRSPIQRWKSPREINVDSNLVPVIILICKGELKDTWIMYKCRKKSKRWFGKTLKLQHLNWISATKVTKPPWHTKPNTFFFVQIFNHIKWIFQYVEKVQIKQNEMIIVTNLYNAWFAYGR